MPSHLYSSKPRRASRAGDPQNPRRELPASLSTRTSTLQWSEAQPLGGGRRPPRPRGGQQRQERQGWAPGKDSEVARLARPSLQPHQLCDGRGLHHEFLVALEKQTEASQVGILVVWQLLLVEEPGHHGLHLQAHVVGEPGEEVVFHVAADERVAKRPVQHGQPGQVKHPQAHHVDPPARKSEEDGKEYHFISTEEMTRSISANEFLEFGSYQGNMFGTKFETVHQIHKQDKVAILDIEPQTLKIVRTAELSPFIVFIAPTDQGTQTDALQQLQKDSEAIRSQYAHYFDLSLVNNSVEETLKTLQEAFDLACRSPQWVPVSWVY